MADKEIGGLTAATTPLAGTELLHLIQSANSRQVAASEIVKISHNQAWSTITSTPTTLSGYGITDAQALDSDLTAIAALDKTDGNFIVADGTAWTVESGATARTSLGLGTAATTAATDYATAAQGTTADSALQPGDIGTTVQAQGATLDSLEGLTLASGDVLYATAADTLANLAKGTEGQVLKVSATGVPEWGTVAGTGDMLAATYDPTSVSGDAFDMANMVEATDAKIMTAAERTKLTGIEAGADVTEATNVDAAGATMNTDTDVSGNSWVLNEDDMASDSATKVPTQQSVKAKIDNDTILKVANRTALKAVDTTKHTAAYLLESGREGQFVWDSSDLSAEVTADTAEGIYVAPTSDATGASGAWVRDHGGILWPLWFGAKFDFSNDDTDAWNGMRSAADETGLPINLPAGRSIINEKITFTTAVNVVGKGRGKTTLWWGPSATSVGIEIPAPEVTDHVLVSGITFERNGAGAGVDGTALRVTSTAFIGSSPQSVTLRDLEARGATGTSKSFAVGFHVTEPRGASIFGISYRGSVDNAATTVRYGTAIKIDGTSNPVTPHLTDLAIYSADIAVDITDVEGTIITSFEFVACGTGVKWRPATDGVNQPHLHVGPGHMNNYNYGIDAKNLSQSFVRDVLSYRRTDASGAFTHFKFDSCLFINISGNTLVDANASSPNSKGIEFVDSSNCVVGENNLQNGTTAISVDSGSSDITILPQRYARGSWNAFISNSGTRIEIPAGHTSVKRSTNQTITSGTAAYLSWEATVSSNQTDIWALSPNPTRLTAPMAGYYRASYDIVWTASGTGQRRVAVHKNGSLMVPGARSNDLAHAGGNWQSATTCPVFLDEGDYIEIEVFQNAGSDMSVLTNSNATLTWVGP